MRFGKLILCLVLVGLSASSAEVPPNAGFVLETKKLQPYTSGFVGNGYFSLVTTPLAITDAQSYMSGVYDHGPDDIPRIALIPGWNAIDIKLGDTWLSKITPSENNIRSYSQQINMYDGLLETRYAWSSGERSAELQVQAFVSRANPHLAAVKLTITPDTPGPLELLFSLKDWPAPKRMPLEKLEKAPVDPPGSYPSPWYPGNMVVKSRDSKASARGARASMVSVAEGKETTVAQVMEVRWNSDLKKITTNTANTDDSASVVIRFEADKKPYTFTKLIAAVPSQKNPDPLKTASEAIDSLRSRSYDVLLADHSRAWHELWKTDIELEGNDELQKIVRSMKFYLLSSIAKDTELGIPPMGLSSDGYYGHIFWDSDTWMFPALLVMHPDIAKSMVMFRYRTLDAAQHKAKELGFRGAMYPWEADEIGNETTPQFAYQNAFSEIHITGDVALAQWQYYLASGDQEWLKEYGYPVLKETADFWVSRVTFNKDKNRYEIEKVTSVNEGLIGIHNETYTNAIAKKNLELATTASGVLGVQANPEWKKIADTIFLPYDEKGEYHLEFENAPESTLGTVVTLLTYPLDLPMSEQARQNNLKFAVRRLQNEASGAMMGITLLPLIAAQLQKREWFDALHPKYLAYLRPPFYALAETPSNRSTNFVTGAGGFLQQVIFGYTGLRLNEDGLTRKYEPMLPSTVKKVKLKNFQVRNKTFNYEVP